MGNLVLQSREEKITRRNYLTSTTCTTKTSFGETTRGMKKRRMATASAATARFVKPPRTILEMSGLTPVRAQADDGHDRATAAGHDDRVDARIKHRADQHTDAGRQVLNLLIGQVNYLGDRRARHQIVPIFIAKFHRDGVFRQECLCPSHRLAYLDRPEELDSRPVGNVRQLQPIRGLLGKVVTQGSDKQFGFKRSDAIVPHSITSDSGPTK